MGNHNKPGISGRQGDNEVETVEYVDLEERRSTVRRSTFKAGEILLPGGGALGCIVRNISDSGCLIKLDNIDQLPDFVDIRIDLSSAARPAEIVWRSTPLAGAMFVREPS